MKTEDGIGYVYSLIEHQSRPDKHMAFRLTRYAIAAMQQHLDAGHEHLPLVVPLLFYHGKKSPYPYSTNWLDEFINPELAKALYSEPYSLVDITVISDDDIMQHKRVVLLEVVQKHIRQRDLLEILDSVSKLLLEHSPTVKQLDSLIEYLVRAGETSSLSTFLFRLTERVPAHEEKIMTVAEQLEARGREQGLKLGRQEGEKLGLQKGLEKVQLDIAKKMLLAGADIQFVLEITGLSKDELSKLAN